MVSLRKRYSKDQRPDAHPLVFISSAPAQGQDSLSLTWILNIAFILSDVLHSHYDASRSEFLFSILMRIQ